MKPQLPAEPTRDPDRISRAWIAQLLRCLRWAMDHPRADGRTIRQDAGILTVTPAAANGGSGGGAAAAGTGILFVAPSGLHPSSPTSGTCALVGSVFAAPAGGTPLATGATILVYGVAAGTLQAADFTGAPRLAAVALGTVTWTGTSGPVTGEAYALLSTLHALV